MIHFCYIPSARVHIILYEKSEEDTAGTGLQRHNQKKLPPLLVYPVINTF